MSKSSNNFILGLLSGALAGSVIGLLYAPDKGSNTRDRVSYRLNNYLEELSTLVERLSDEKAMVSDAKRKGDLVVEDARKRAEDLIHEAEDLLHTIESAKKGEEEI